MSILTQTKRERQEYSCERDEAEHFNKLDRKKSFLHLKVGDDLESIVNAIRYETDCDIKIGLGYFAATALDEHINVDENTKREFFDSSSMHQHTYVAKVDEDYALVVKVREFSRVTDVGPQLLGRMDPYYWEMDFQIDVSCFMLGRDDGNRIFIHYLDKEVNKRVKIHEMNMSQPTTTAAMQVDPLKYYVRNNPDLFHKFKDFDMNEVLRFMNREDQGYDRLQGDLVVKLVEGRKGRCRTCTVPKPRGGMRFVEMYDPPKTVYSIRSRDRESINIDMCEECIKHLDRNDNYKDGSQAKKRYAIRLGNHVLRYDSSVLPLKEFKGIVEAGTQFTSTPFTFMVDSSMSDEDAEQITMSLNDSRARGFSWTLDTQLDEDFTAAFDRVAARLPPSKPIVHSEVESLDLTDSIKMAWTIPVGVPTFAVAMGGQHLILEHQQHEHQKLYVPKDSIAVFEFQRAAPVVNQNAE